MVLKFPWHRNSLGYCIKKYRQRSTFRGSELARLVSRPGFCLVTQQLGDSDAGSISTHSLRNTRRGGRSREKVRGDAVNQVGKDLKRRFQSKFQVPSMGLESRAGDPRAHSLGDEDLSRR